MIIITDKDARIRELEGEVLYLKDLIISIAQKSKQSAVIINSLKDDMLLTNDKTNKRQKNGKN